jgi:hypothetical protein
MSARTAGHPIPAVVMGVMLLGLVVAAPAGAAIITVTGTGDTIVVDGLVTLREALTAANTNAASGDAPAGDPGLDEIRFNISGLPGTVRTIQPSSMLPTITDPVFINGYSQLGASPNTLLDGSNAFLAIELDGSLTNFAAGLSIGNGGGGSTIQGLVINRFDNEGILVTSAGNVIRGNFLGTDPTGKLDRGNGSAGVTLAGSNNTVGGAAPADRNLISGNNFAGVTIGNTTSTGNHVEGNLIGTDDTGVAALGNTGAGVRILSAPGNAVGGTTGNVIAFNAGPGILIGGNTAVRNALLGNSIHDNTGPGIDLNNDGVTPNDLPGALDADTGPNGHQNFPILASAVANGPSTVIVGRLDSAAATPYRVEFFASASCDASGNGEGTTFLGSQNVTTSAGGSADLFFGASADLAPVGRVITATATDPVGSTSEFSPCLAVTMPVVTVAATEPAATEAGQTSGVLTFSRTGDPAAALTVFFTVAGTATPGADHAALPASVQIPAGQASATVLVTAVDDALAEGNETVTATVSANPAYVVGTPSGATVTIVDDEVPPVPPTVTVAATGATATETATPGGTVTFTRTGSTGAALTVLFTVSGTASPGFDYQTLPASVVIPAGQASVTLPVVPVDDPLVEGQETVIVTLGPDAAYVVGDPSAATVAIDDDDTEPLPLPQLTGVLNQTAFQTGQPLTLNVLLTPGTTPTLADAYVVVQLPGGVFISVLLTGVAGGVVPIATSFAPFDFSGQLIAYTFTGLEEPGTYTVFVALTQPGTLIPIGQIQMLTFTFTP